MGQGVHYWDMVKEESQTHGTWVLGPLNIFQPRGLYDQVWDDGWQNLVKPIHTSPLRTSNGNQQLCDEDSIVQS